MGRLCFDATRRFSDLGRLINHSPKGFNAKPGRPIHLRGKWRVGLVAVRDITIGDEITDDYGVRSMRVEMERQGASREKMGPVWPQPPPRGREFEGRRPGTREITSGAQSRTARRAPCSSTYKKCTRWTQLRHPMLHARRGGRPTTQSGCISRTRRRGHWGYGTSASFLLHLRPRTQVLPLQELLQPPHQRLNLLLPRACPPSATSTVVGCSWMACFRI